MTIELWTVIFTILNTLILYLFMKKYFFNKVTDFINKRQNSIESKINEANINFEKSSKMAKEYEEKLKQIEIDGKAIIEEYKNKAFDLYEDIIEEAKKEAELIRERAKRDAEMEKERVRDEIKRQVVDLSVIAASKAIEEELDYEKHHKLIMDFIDKVGC